MYFILMEFISLSAYLGQIMGWHTNRTNYPVPLVCYMAHQSGINILSLRQNLLEKKKCIAQVMITEPRCFKSVFTIAIMPNARVNYLVNKVSIISKIIKYYSDKIMVVLYTNLNRERIAIKMTNLTRNANNIFKCFNNRP